MGSDKKGEWVGCSHCRGGMRMASNGDPQECSVCDAVGSVWQYPSGRRALYSGGPFTSG